MGKVVDKTGKDIPDNQTPETETQKKESWLKRAGKRFGRDLIDIGIGAAVVCGIWAVTIKMSGSGKSTDQESDEDTEETEESEATDEASEEE